MTKTRMQMYDKKTNANVLKKTRIKTCIQMYEKNTHANVDKNTHANV